MIFLRNHTNYSEMFRFRIIFVLQDYEELILYVERRSHLTTLSLPLYTGVRRRGRGGHWTGSGQVLDSRVADLSFQLFRLALALGAGGLGKDRQVPGK